ncbi:NnrS family protein [Thiohalorhabdus methylotrophus]|uniref:NnrS family protein n=1 Tax=Thiohalorhabdus methylotrophus TaxID=3242694 RepID=A0ABV4TRW2_9GAMM
MPRTPAVALFFPSAALLAVTVVVAKALEASGLGVPWHASVPLRWHGHEMLFGYAYAVVGGFLLTRPDPARILAAYLAWLAGRVVYLGAALPFPVELGAALAYPLLLFAYAGLPLARAAKKPRNKMFAPLIAALALAELLYQLGLHGVLPGAAPRGLLLAADLLLLLLFVMGGRILATSSSGAHQDRGRRPAGVAQPRLERAGAALLAGTALADATGLATPLPGDLSLGAALVVLVRIIRWRGWLLLGDRALAALQAGYLWLALGLFAKGAVQVAGNGLPFEALHVALIGGLGTLTATVMSRVALQRTRRGSGLPASVVAAVLLLALAVPARLEAGVPAGLWLAAAAWGTAFSLVLAALAGAAFRPAGSRPEPPGRGQRGHR